MTLAMNTTCYVSGNPSTDSLMKTHTERVYLPWTGIMINACRGHNEMQFTRRLFYLPEESKMLHICESVNLLNLIEDN